MFNVQRAITPKVGKPELLFMCSACHLIMLYICVKFRENIANGVRVMEQTQYMVEMAMFNVQRVPRTVFSEENVFPSTSLNRHIVKIDCIYNKLKVTIYLYVSLVKIHPFLNEIGG